MEAVGDKNGAVYFLMIVEINRVESRVRVGHSRSGSCWKSFPRGFEVKSDQEIRGKSNVEVSKTESDRLASNLILGKASPNS